jgi:cysteine-S-conjugate beta-lyase
VQLVALASIILGCWLANAYNRLEYLIWRGLVSDFDVVHARCNSDSQKWRGYPPDVLPLWVADMDFQAPEAVLQAMHAMVEHGIFGYGCSAGYHELVNAWVERLAVSYHWQVAPLDLMLLPGVVLGANLACRVLASPGDEALVPAPVYGPLLHAPRYGQLTCVPVLLACDKDGYYSLDYAALQAAVTPKTRLLILCNPHNPVGRVYTRVELERLADFCLHNDLYLISDEIHCDFVYRGYQHTPIASTSAEIAARTVTLMAPSKTFNIPGLHSAVAVVTDKGLRERLTAGTLGLMPGITPIASAATIAAFREGQLWLDELLVYLQQNRDIVTACVKASLPGIHVTAPEGTYLAWLDCRDANLPVRASTFFLEQARVALSDGCGYGAGNEAYVRLNFGCPRSILEEALTRMVQAWADRCQAAQVCPGGDNSDSEPGSLVDPCTRETLQ